MVTSRKSSNRANGRDVLLTDAKSLWIIRPGAPRDTNPTGNNAVMLQKAGLVPAFFMVLGARLMPILLFDDKVIEPRLTVHR